MSVPAARARVARHDLLIELGTEELPPKSLHLLEQAFAQGLRTLLAQSGWVVPELQSFATPRRLALLVRRLPARQPDQAVKRRGPPLTAALDAAGQPTRAAAAFAASCGVAFESLQRERDTRGTEYLAFEGLKPGADTRLLLPRLIQQALEALPVARRMRWGALEAQFVRPVHWLVLLYGDEVVPATLFGVESGRLSRGHRFMAPAPLRIGSPSRYARTLAERGRVLAPFAERAASIRAQVEALAAGFGGSAIIDAALLEEVTALVEWPTAIAGRFDERYLELPREVLISTLQEHQRYFALEGRDRTLLPWFITVSNIESPEPEVVRAGNERVVRPRLADAAFFWQQDRARPLAARRPALDEVTFQAELGSQGARSERLAALASTIAARIGADAAAAERAAQLAKCDLLTAMVREFPELQGIVGYYYALADGEPAAVAEAIREHYLPRSAGDALPASRLGDAVALADKLDVLAGIFALGQKPTGTRDPFGLRRAAIGVMRILLEHQLELDLVELIAQAVRLQPLPGLEQRAALVSADIYDYVIERLRAHCLERSAESGISTEMFDAVLATRPPSLLDFAARLQALVGFIARPAGAALASANKRIANILRKSDPAQRRAVEATLLREPAEQALYETTRRVRAPVLESIQARAYAAAFEQLAALRPEVDAFFDRVLVNDPDPALRDNRFALLRELAALFGGIADLSCLPG
jgi:glycyl-tRNA synthetase beta chain